MAEIDREQNRDRQSASPCVLRRYESQSRASRSPQRNRAPDIRSLLATRVDSATTLPCRIDDRMRSVTLPCTFCAYSSGGYLKRQLACSASPAVSRAMAPRLKCLDHLLAVLLRCMPERSRRTSIADCASSADVCDSRRQIYALPRARRRAEPARSAPASGVIVFDVQLASAARRPDAARVQTARADRDAAARGPSSRPPPDRRSAERSDDLLPLEQREHLPRARDHRRRQSRQPADLDAIRTVRAARLQAMEEQRL